MFTSDDWIVATTDDLDFCQACGMHTTECDCDDVDSEACVWCNASLSHVSSEHYPYCSATCTMLAGADSDELN